MRRRIIVLSLLITITVICIVSIKVYSYYQYAKKQTISFHQKKCKEDSLKVIFYGDSWAAYHYDYDNYLESLLCQNRIKVSVSSNGYVGAKSKELYCRLFTSAKPLLEQQPNYCILSVGINDAVAKMGDNFYTYHYLLIVQLLLKAGIKPVVIEMPDVNYQAIASREQWPMRIRHQISAFLTGSEMYGFDSYRKALKEALIKEGLIDSLVYIKKESWNSIGYQDSRNLYLMDETHLNANGYQILDSCLAIEILHDMTNNKMHKRYE